MSKKSKNSTSSIIFKKIGIIGRKINHNIGPTVTAVYNLLHQLDLDIIIDTKISSLVNISDIKSASRAEIGQECDLAVVVGGDGSILHSARTLAGNDIAVVGIHRGRLGFLTDIAPDNIDTQLLKILHGDFIRHELCLLHADVIENNKIKKRIDAVNEVVINSGSITKMIEFDVYINDQFVYRQRSDGLIIATTTGSTAYALSGGGPILTPNLGVLTMVPMFPHNLTSRPIVIPDDSIIKILPVDPKLSPSVSCDGQPLENLTSSDKLEIYKSGKVLHLLHPSDYNYYETLRTKLHWGTKQV